jgi:hypothetical protein
LETDSTVCYPQFVLGWVGERRGIFEKKVIPIHQRWALVWAVFGLLEFVRYVDMADEEENVILWTNE